MSRTSATSAPGARPDGLGAFPAEPAAAGLHLTATPGCLAVSTLRWRLAAISEAHEAARFENPTIDAAVRTTWAGVRRTHGTAPETKAAAVTEVVAAMVAPLGESLIETRDQAILLLGFAGALQRSELSALDVGDVVETAEGLKLTVARSKTDQETDSHTVGIIYGSNPSTCPLRASRAWLAAAQLTSRPAFRRLPNDRVTPDRLAGDGIARMVKRRASAAGYAPGAGQAMRGYM
jgi:hypothetical protein